MKSDKKSWNQIQGLAGEALAKEFLKKQGYKIIAERYRTAFGEVDLVALLDGVVLFAEVKSRTGPDFGDPLEAVTPTKIRHFQRAASGFLIEFPQYSIDHFWEFAAIGIRIYDDRTEIEMVKILP